MSARGFLLTLPPAPHMPGRTPRPPETLFEPLKDGLSAGMTPAALAESRAFRGALEAMSQQYFWEAHELFEAVWACLPPAGAERCLLRGLIQTANAGLKARMGRASSAARIGALADASLAEAFLYQPVSLMGLTPADTTELRRCASAACSDSNNAK